MNRTDRVRAALAARPATPPAAPPPAPDPAPELTAKEVRAAKRAASPTVTHACGHSRPLVELTNAHCPACREKTRQERAVRKRARRDAEKAATPAHSDAGRLPDGSMFQTLWDAASGQWGGTLTVPVCPPVVFTAKASGVFALLKALDALYRAAIAANPTGEPS